MKFHWLSCEDDVTWSSWRWYECLTNRLMTICQHIIIITLLRKNRDVCLIEMVNHITTNNCYCFSFWPWKHFCLSCFVGYRRSILYTFEISFHRFHSSFIFLMCSHLMCFSPIQKYLISCFHILKISCICSTWKIWTFWRRIRSLLFTRRSLLSLSCVDYLWVERSVMEFPSSLYIIW